MDTENLRRRLWIALALNASIVGSEFVGGLLIHSVALMSDAMHNLVDQGALFLTLYATILASRKATARLTYGYHRAGIATALVNAAALLIVSIGLAAMAARRLFAPTPTAGGWIIAIALLSFAANMAIALLLQSAAKDDLNIRGAFWHMFGDAWVSFGVALSGLAILLKGWYIVDPIVSFAVVFAILKGAWPVLKESLEVLMESAPEYMDASRAAQAVREVPGVKNVHDVHVWAVKPGLLVFTGHVMAQDGVLSQELLTAVRRRLAQTCKIQHITVQLETSCCHAEAAHCDLGELGAAHQSGAFATMTSDYNFFRNQGAES